MCILLLISRHTQYKSYNTINRQVIKIMNRLKHFLPMVISIFIFSCTTTSEISDHVTHVAMPNNWQLSEEQASVESNWLAKFNDPQLQFLVRKALNNNRDLLISAYDLSIQEEELTIDKTALWPELDLNLRSRRDKRTGTTFVSNDDGDDEDELENSTVQEIETASFSSDHDLDFNINYEVDIWGKLSALERTSYYNLLSEKASYEEERQQLVVNVINTWFNIIEANQLLLIFEKEAHNSKENLSVIEAGYNSGLTEALDIYLARNDLNSSLSQVAEQKLVSLQLIRQLEQLIGDYPVGKLIVDAELPLISDDIPAGLPSELLSRKPQVKSSWYSVLASDANVAYRHKQRFPSIDLSFSIGSSQSDLNNLLSPGALAWSLIGNVSAPLFNGGGLLATEDRAKISLKQSEQNYLNVLYRAFEDVENGLSQEQSLKERYQYIVTAQTNAQFAAMLSFEQYKSGLVTYTTLLDAQDRLYSAQRNLIQIKQQLLENRVNLHVALGGSFTTELLENKAQ